MRLTVIHNPTSGDAELSAVALRSMLEDAGYQVRYASSKGAWEKALQAPADLLVVAGGDGTVRKVLVEAAGTGVPVGILPVGTANNIAKSLGIVGATDRIVRGWRRGRPQPFDVGVASAAREDRRFVESFGGGLFARLIERGHVEAGPAGAYVGRETDRALNLFREILAAARPARWELELDGRDLSGSYLAVEALNTRFGGPNVPLAPGADTADGLLDVVLLRSRDRDRMLEYVARRLELGAGSLPDLPVHRGRWLRVVPPREVELHLDDEGWEGPAGPAGSRGARPARVRRMVDVLLRPGAAQVVTGT